MGREKLRIANTELDNLLGNLRGEVGEIITSWVLLRYFMAEGARLASGDPAKDMGEQNLAFVNLLADKMRDELLGRLSEIAEQEIGRLTFYFAARKLGGFEADAATFERYIRNHRIREKRNRDVSHKQLPEKWSDHRDLRIPYRALIKAVALALRIMKRIDRHALGPSAPYLWRQARKRRYQFMSPPRAGYMLVPYLNLPPDERIRILEEELREGVDVWSEMPTMINGQPVKVLACKKLGIIVLGDRVLALEQYPLQKLSGIKATPASRGEQQGESPSEGNA